AVPHRPAFRLQADAALGGHGVVPFVDELTIEHNQNVTFAGGDFVFVPRSERRPVLDERSALRSLYLAAAHAEEAAGLAVIPLYFERHGPRVLDLIGEDEESGVRPL